MLIGRGHRCSTLASFQEGQVAPKLKWILLESVLDPEPIVKLHELADSSVNFVCRPWVKPEDYWDVYWYITREVKRRFDAEGVSIPFPQTDVHFYQEAIESKPE